MASAVERTRLAATAAAAAIGVFLLFRLAVGIDLPALADVPFLHRADGGAVVASVPPERLEPRDARPAATAPMRRVDVAEPRRAAPRSVVVTRVAPLPPSAAPRPLAPTPAVSPAPLPAPVATAPPTPAPPLREPQLVVQPAPVLPPPPTVKEPEPLPQPLPEPLPLPSVEPLPLPQLPDADELLTLP